MCPAPTRSWSPPIRSSDAELIVAEARTWVGTPYRHQGRAKGRRVDCVGLILGVGQQTGLLNVSAEAWAPYSGYARTPNPKRMGEAMDLFLRELDWPREEPAPDGAIGWLQWRDDLPMHLAIMATFQGRRTMIHAFEGVEACVEHGFVAEWPSRVASWWAYPGKPN
jgi:NlpC/P60 family putative phage cell wall peptidase